MPARSSCGSSATCGSSASTAQPQQHLMAPTAWVGMRSAFMCTCCLAAFSKSDRSSACHCTCMVHAIRHARQQLLLLLPPHHPITHS